MKKISALLILTFTLLIISNVESSAQCTSCPGNPTPTSFPITLATGCVAYVHYCFDCAPTGHPVAQFCMVAIPNNASCNGSEWEVDVKSVNFESGECDYLPFELNQYSLPSWCTSIGCE